MRNLLQGLAVAMIAALAITSCSKKSQIPPNRANPNDTTKTTTTTPKDSVTDVYVCGMEFAAGSSHFAEACYWKNGAINYLQVGSQGSIANCIAVVDTDVYIGGIVDNSAVYWKNGVLHTIGDGTDTSSCLAIAVIHDTIYAAVSGQASIGEAITSYTLMIPPSGGSVESGIFDAQYHPQVYGITAANGKIYCAGAGTTTDVLEFGLPHYQQTPKIWISGQETELDYSTPFADVVYKGGQGHAIVLSGNDVYTAGTQYIGIPTNDVPDYISHPTYWKNQTAVELDPDPNTPGLGAAFGIALSGSDIYVCGEEYGGGTYNPCMWKNGAKSWLGNSGGEANSISVSDSDVYVCGEVPVNSGFDGAHYWKNGADNALSPTLYSSYAYGIFAIKH